ncbi:MAG: proline--tRNA ligase [Mycoplasmatota bacterium]
MKNKAITSRDVDFAQWYTDIIKSASLASYSKVKGALVIEPNGYAIWEKYMEILNKMFKESGHQNVSMPLLIPESLLKKESDLIKGFAPEVAWVTKGGEKELEEKMAIRPTSETLFSDYYKDVVKSYRDLPKKYNQWCSVMRFEKETRPFLRGREFLWQEGHTVHSTAKEAKEETLNMLNIYKKFFEDYLAIPVLTGKKTKKEKFAGAQYTYTVEAMMYNGVILQSGTSHYFGQKFSKAYDIEFLNKKNELENAYQTSWGLSTRAIGALIMVHSDNKGLILPPKIAPTQVCIIPIGDDKIVNPVISKIEKQLKEISYIVDRSEKSPGFKFAQAEVNGIPIRIEVGARDLANNKITLVRRDTSEKYEIDVNIDMYEFVLNLMDEIQTNLLYMASIRKEERTYTAKTYEEIETIMNNKPGFVKADWCGSEKCELKLKDINGTKSRCILEKEELITGQCVVCGKKAKHLVVWGMQY